MAKKAAAAKPAELPPPASVAGTQAETEPVKDRSNLWLWDQVFATDPAHTKGFKRAGGFAGTAIKPYWLIKRATQQFGPIGIGWGWEVVEERREDGPEARAMWFSKVMVWFMHQGQRVEVGPQWGGTELVAVRRDGGIFFDEEAPKKSVTDGITKCLSYLGFGGDVHMGLFDDSKYVSDTEAAFRRAEVANGTGGARGASPDEDLKSAQAWRDSVVASAKAAPDTTTLQELWRTQKDVARAYAGSERQDLKAIANYVKSQVERRAHELKQDQAAEAPQTAAE